MDEELLTVVSPRHAVRLASEYLPFLKQAPSKDFVVRTLVQREHEGTPLMSADIVIAGRETREQFPLAVTYPLHEGGLAHGDAELHNLIVGHSPIEIVPIDFEVAVERDTVDAARWTKTCECDLVPLLREATLVQCRIGKQEGQLAELARARIGACFKNPERFTKEIESGSPKA